MKKSKRQQAIPKVEPAVLPTTPPPMWASIGAVATIIALSAIPKGPLFLFPPTIVWPGVALAITAIFIKMRTGSRFTWFPLKTATHVGEAIGLTAVFGTFFLLKLVGLHASGTDDNIYFYLANRTAEGAVPYRDFFFSHPPLHLLIPAFLFKIFGFSVGLAKLIPFLAQVMAGVFLYLSVRRGGPTFAILVVAFALGAYQILMGSTDMNGENIMTMFVAQSMFAATRKRYAIAGALGAMALGCGLYALAAVVGLFVATIFAERDLDARPGIIGHPWARFATGLTLGLAVVFLPFAIAGGFKFFNGVFAYHLAKPIKDSGRQLLFESANPFVFIGALIANFKTYLGSDTFGKSLYFHTMSYIGAILATVWIAARALRSWWGAQTNSKDGNRKGWESILSPRDMLAGTPQGFAKFAILTAILFGFQWGAVNEVYDFYHVPMLMILAIPPAFVVWRILAKIACGRLNDIAIAATLGGLFWLHVPWAYHVSDAMWPSERVQAGEVVNYQWRDPEILAGPATITKALFFNDSRVKGTVTPHYRHFMWNKMLTFQSAHEIADYIRSNTTPDETITGASTLAPLIALLAERRMAGDEADTNGKRFSSGLLGEGEFFDLVCGDNVRYVVSASRSHFGQNLFQKNPSYSRTFRPERTFMDPQLVHFRDFPITLYRRNDLSGLPNDKVCTWQGVE